MAAIAAYEQLGIAAVGRYYSIARAVCLET